MPRCSFTFGQIEELLAKAHRIDPSKRTAFQGRLKHLQRWGFPSGAKPGKGKAIAYTAEHLYMMVLAMELIQAGMPPKLSADLIRDNWHNLRTTVYLNMHSEGGYAQAGSKSPPQWCWLFRPEALRDITSDGTSEVDHFDAVLTVELSGLTKYLSAGEEAAGGVLGRSWRTLVINGGPLVRGVDFLIESEFRWATKDELRHDMLVAIESAQEAINEAGKKIADILGDWKAEPPIRPAVSERFPVPIVSMAKETLNQYRDLIAKIAIPEGESTEILQSDVEVLRDAGILTIEIEGIVLTKKGVLITELLQEEHDRGEHP